MTRGGSLLDRSGWLGALMIGPAVLYIVLLVGLPFVLALANKGWRQALLADPHLRNGLNIHDGKVTYKAVAEDLGYDFVDPMSLIAA